MQSTLIHAHADWHHRPLRMAADETGLVSLLLGDEKSTLRELRARFPRHSLRDEHCTFFDHALQRLDHRDAPMPRLSLHGTAFQQSVWRVLADIPFGGTRTYADIACAIGRPRSARAVAGACAANPIAILVPCHRVIRGDGTLSGYRWGVGVKRDLLAWEQSLTPCA